MFITRSSVAIIFSALLLISMRCVSCQRRAIQRKTTEGWRLEDVPHPMRDPQLCSGYDVKATAICDPEGLLSEAAHEELDGRINGIRDVEIGILIVSRIAVDGSNKKQETAQRLAVEIHNEWGLGARNRNNGVMVLVAVKDRVLYISTGAGVPAPLSDQNIAALVDLMKLPLRQQKYDAALSDCITYMHLLCSGESLPSLQVDQHGKHREASRSQWQMNEDHVAALSVTALMGVIIVIRLMEARRLNRMRRAQQALQDLLSDIDNNDDGSDEDDDGDSGDGNLKVQLTDQPLNTKLLKHHLNHLRKQNPSAISSQERREILNAARFSDKDRIREILVDKQVALQQIINTAAPASLQDHKRSTSQRQLLNLFFDIYSSHRHHPLRKTTSFSFPEVTGDRHLSRRMLSRIQTSDAPRRFQYQAPQILERLADIKRKYPDAITSERAQALHDAVTNGAIDSFRSNIQHSSHEIVKQMEELRKSTREIARTLGRSGSSSRLFGGGKADGGGGAGGQW